MKNTDEQDHEQDEDANNSGLVGTSHRAAHPSHYPPSTVSPQHSANTLRPKIAGGHPLVRGRDSSPPLPSDRPCRSPRPSSARVPPGVLG